MIEPFLSAVPVLEKLEMAGYEAYFVGGSVRDFLLHKTISDVDIATSATPDEVKKIFPKTVDIGIEHGTVLVLFQNQSYEITTFRTEAEYQDFRRPKEVTFIRVLSDDLQRRDFTMNAIAMNREGKIIDPFDGQTAIKEKIIRTVGDAKERFQEDALRMMRAVRFVSQLSFHIEEKSLAALKKLVSLLENIAIERKREEFQKLFAGANRKQALELIIETNIYSFLPGLQNKKEEIQDMLSFNMDRLSPREMWALLGYCLKLKGKEIEGFFRNWRFPLKEIREIQHILLFLEKRLQSEWSTYDLYIAGKAIIQSTEILYLVLEGIRETSSIHHFLQLYKELPLKSRSQMKVTGNDLMIWYERNAGPWLKEKLDHVELAILEGHVANDKQRIKEWLSRCNHK
nr:CCA tRNA nucleotidyltransferase [Neobacillus sp. Marseille-Q6967]